MVDVEIKTSNGQILKDPPKPLWQYSQDVGELNPMVSQYFPPTTAADINPYLKGKYQDPLYYQFENDKQRLSQGRPIETLQEEFTARYGKNFDINADIPTIYSGSVPNWHAGEKEAMYKQIAQKYSSSEALNAGVPQSYVDAAAPYKQLAKSNTYSYGSPEWYNFEIAQRELAAKTNTIGSGHLLVHRSSHKRGSTALGPNASTTSSSQYAHLYATLMCCDWRTASAVTL